MHIELFARRQVIVVPAGIGVAPPLVRRDAGVRGGRCSYSIRTLEPTGVVEFDPSRHARLRELFEIWGQPLSRTRLAGFSGRVRAYVRGRTWRGHPGAIPLRRHMQVVLEVGGYVPPHRFFLFGPGR
jgi:hypothetical protein